jgi:hypothetical protein
MSDSAEFWDALTQAEAHSAQAIMRGLAAESWAQPLLAAIANNGGLIRAALPKECFPKHDLFHRFLS